jgi:hypothetical protein
MAHTGMVHALEKIHRLLKTDGTLIDIHPIPKGYSIKVLQGEHTLFAEWKRETLSEDILAAEKAIALALERGLYTLEEAVEIEYLTYGSSAKELQDFWAEQNTYDDRPVDAAMAAREEELFAQADEILKAADEGAQIVIHERVTISLLRP